MISADIRLDDIVPLNRLGSAARARLASGLREIVLATGDPLFAIGEELVEHFYVREGCIELLDEEDAVVLSVGYDQGAVCPLLPVASPSPHQARATRASRIVAVDRAMLDEVILREDPQSAHSVEVAYATRGGTEAWRDAFLRARGYAGIGRDRLQRLFTALQPVALEAGEIFIREGDCPDYFYVVAQGRCEVLRKLQDLDDMVKVAEYGPGASVGEDALIGDGLRNATVRMVTDGRVMRLAAEHFRELLLPPLAIGLDAQEARAQVCEGAQWLDVRLPREVRGCKLPGAVHIPHPVVRARLFSADPACRYVVACASGRDAPVIAFMLSKYGFDARYLRDGIATLADV